MIIFVSSTLDTESIIVASVIGSLLLLLLLLAARCLCMSVDRLIDCARQ